MLGIFFMFLSSSADLFIKLNYTFQDILSGTLSECQTIWIQISRDVLSTLDLRQTRLQRLSVDAKVAPNMDRVKNL